MNPWSVVILIVGVLIVIVGIKGNLPNVIAEIKGIAPTVRQASGTSIPANTYIPPVPAAHHTPQPAKMAG